MKYFYTIAECESLSKAAEKLHTSQPTLSRNLAALEEELGTTLFDRVGRSIVLNDAGRVALKRAISVLNSADALNLKWPENETMNWATLRFREFVVDHFNKTHDFACKI